VAPFVFAADGKSGGRRVRRGRQWKGPGGLSGSTAEQHAKKRLAGRWGRGMGLADWGKRLFYVFMQCTWGGVQTCLGLLLFLYYRGRPHQVYHGAVYTKWKLDGGLSLGLFIFTPDKEEAWCCQMAVHEYGHTWQSLMLGPFYLIVVGVPSFIWSRSKRCIGMRREKKVPYSAFYTERWADRLGEKMAAVMR